MADFDLAILGGGLNGLSIARDAAGRGLKVLVLERGDLGAGASATASPLIQCDLRALENRWIGKARRAVTERDIWLKAAPHLVRPVRVVVPMHGEMRPPWLWRLGLAVHDRLSTDRAWPRSETIDLTHHRLGDPLKRPFGLALDYGAGLADSPRLTILTAIDAARRGATIITGARCIRADRSDIWRIVAVRRGQRQIFAARALVNATGGWLGTVAETVLRLKPPPIRLARANQVVVRALFDHDSPYLLQQPDGRLVHVVPLEGKATLIGSVERGFAGDPAHAAVSADDALYLIRAVNRYFREQLEPSDVLHSVAGVHVRDASSARAAASGEGGVRLERRFGEAPLLTSFGGETTTARRQAEAAMTALAPFYAMPGPWTAQATLPGGDVAHGDVGGLVDGIEARWPFLTRETVRRLASSYGTLTGAILDGVASRDDLGPDFGEGLSGREVDYLMTREWARFPDDVLWRRSSLGLSMRPGDREALAAFMTSRPTAVGRPLH